MRVPELHKRTLVASVILAWLVGCTAEMPAAKTVPAADRATLSFSRGSPQMEIGPVVLDGQSVPSSADSVVIAPGGHSISVGYVVTTMDLCDGLGESCPTSVVRGSCSGSFSVSAAESSVVAFDSSRGAVRAVVRPPLKFGDLFADAPAPKAELSCSNGSTTQGATRGAM